MPKSKKNRMTSVQKRLETLNNKKEKRKLKTAMAINAHKTRKNIAKLSDTEPPINIAQLRPKFVETGTEVDLNLLSDFKETQTDLSGNNYDHLLNVIRDISSQLIQKNTMLEQLKHKIIQLEEANLIISAELEDLRKKIRGKYPRKLKSVEKLSPSGQRKRAKSIAREFSNQISPQSEIKQVEAIIKSAKHMVGIYSPKKDKIASSSYQKLTSRSSNEVKLPILADIFITTVLGFSSRQRERLKTLLISQGRDILAPTSQLKELKRNLVSHADYKYFDDEDVLICVNVKKVLEERIKILLDEKRLEDTCEQAALIWRQVYTTDRRVKFEHPFTDFLNQWSLMVLQPEPPADYGSRPPPGLSPLYWPLPERFLGDRTTSYNGFLRFRITNEDNRRQRGPVPADPQRFKQYPLVVLVGSDRIELEYVPTDADLPQSGLGMKFRVRLHESQWRIKTAPHVSVDRKKLMVALHRVQSIYIRATFTDLYRGDSISLTELSMDVAGEPPADGIGHPQALGVERCRNCARGYTGLSCQSAAAGFHLTYTIPRVTRLDDKDDIKLVPVAVHCACNGHSTSCDPNTGRCYDCKHNTAGDGCERCKEGFYGSARDGGPESCHRCACPSTGAGSFSKTCRLSTSAGRGYVCDACKQGYLGEYCERCAPGYYGDPMAPDGRCLPCQCHPSGSLHPGCHNTTGQCDCRPGVTGRDCSVCQPRHAFLNGVCTSCDQGCYKDLMKMEDEMELSLVNLSEQLAVAKPIPRKRLHRIEDTVATLNALLDAVQTDMLDDSSDQLQLLWSPESGSNRLSQLASLSSELQLVAERGNESLARIQRVLDGIREIRASAREKQLAIQGTLSKLSAFMYASPHGGAHLAEVSYAVEQARARLATIRDRNATIEKSYNYAKKNVEDAERLHAAVLAKKLDRKSYEELAAKAENISALVRDFRDTLWDQSRAVSSYAKETTESAKQSLTELDSISAEINAVRDEFYAKLNRSKEALSNGTAALGDASNIYEETRSQLLPQLRGLSTNPLLVSSRESDTEMASMLKRARVDEAEQHTRQIEALAHSLSHQYRRDVVQFNNTLEAVTAYKDIAEALRNASEAAAVAHRNANDAFSVVDPSKESSLVRNANHSLTRAKELENRVHEVLNQLAVDAESARLQATLNRIRQLQDWSAKNISQIKAGQQTMDDYQERLQTVYPAVDEQLAAMNGLEERVEGFVEAVEDLAKRAADAEGFTAQGIRDDIAALADAEKGLGDAQRGMTELQQRTERQEEELRGMRKNIGVLQAKIREAREKASKVRLGFRAEPGANCTRQYASPLGPSPAETISMMYRPALDSPDSLLFFTEVPGTRTQPHQYIAIQLRAKKLHVVWDIGAGRREAALIDRSLVYIPSSDRNSWYHIVVRRVGNSVRASVVQRRAQAGENGRDLELPASVEVGDLVSGIGGEGDSDTPPILFQSAPGKTLIHVGHPDRQLTKALGLATNEFVGTLGALEVGDGDHPIPLWVFQGTTGGGGVRTGDGEGCEGAPGLPRAVAQGHRFRGGFAQIRMPITERPNQLLSVQFSSLSPNGLLYFRGSTRTGDFLAMELHEGALEAKASFDDGHRVALRTNASSYADGRSHRVRLIRNMNGEVHLDVDGVDRVSLALEKPLVLKISEPEHFVGGVPPEFPKERFASTHGEGAEEGGHDEGKDEERVHFDGFFGCIHVVKPSQVSELDLDHPTRVQSTSRGCAFREERLVAGDRLLGFPGEDPAGQDSFLKARGLVLGANHSSLAFNFRTRSASALILHQSGRLLQTSAERRLRARMARRRRRMMKKRKRREEEGETEGVPLPPEEPTQDESFLAVYLYEGRVVVHLGTDSDLGNAAGRAHLATAKRYDDGFLHSVFISRHGTEVRLRIDDNREQLIAALDDQRPIGGSSSSTQTALVLGGFPQRYRLFVQQHQEHEMATTSPFRGCLSDFLLDFERWKLVPEEHVGITFGSCPDFFDDELGNVGATSARTAALRSLSSAEQREQHQKQKEDEFQRQGHLDDSELLLREATVAGESTVNTIDDDEISNIGGEKIQPPATKEGPVNERRASKLSLTDTEPASYTIEKDIVGLSQQGSEDEPMAMIMTNRSAHWLPENQCPAASLSDSELLHMEDSHLAAEHFAIGVRYGVTETSHSKLRFGDFEDEGTVLDPANFTVSLDFRTAQSHQNRLEQTEKVQQPELLWAWANFRRYTRYIHLLLDNGFLVLELKGQKPKPRTLVYRAKRFDDGQWHTVRIAKQDREITLQVDDLPVEKLINTAHVRLARRRMYIGGVPTKLRHTFDDQYAEDPTIGAMPPGFLGCVRNARVQGRTRDLLESSRDIVLCTHTRGVAYIHEGGYALLPSLEEHSTRHGTGPAHYTDTEHSEIALSLSFRLARASQRSSHVEAGELSRPGGWRTEQDVFVVGFLPATKSGQDLQESPRLTVGLRNGTVVLSVYPQGSSPSNIAVERFSEFVFDGQRPFQNPLVVCSGGGRWHHLALRVGSKGGWVELDGTREEFSFGRGEEHRLPRDVIWTLRALPVHIGGANAPTRLALGVRSLLGCVRQLELGGVPISVDEDGAKKLHKVVPDGCPLA